MGLVAERGLLKVGIRMNSRESLGVVLDLVREDGWEVSRRPVEVAYLYSMWVATQRPQHRRRSRGFHLLYSGPGQISRSLDLEEVLTALRRDLRLAYGALDEHRILVSGTIISHSGRVLLILDTDQGLPLPILRELEALGAEVGERQSCFLNQRAEFVEALSSNLWRKLDLIADISHGDSNGSNWKVLDTGRSALQLSRHSRSQAKTAFPIIAELIQRVRCIRGQVGAARESAQSLLAALAESGTQPV